MFTFTFNTILLQSQLGDLLQITTLRDNSYSSAGIQFLKISDPNMIPGD